MLCVLDKLELYISCIFKMSKIITLFWNSEDDSACMSLCRQGVLAEAKGLLICLPIPPLHPELQSKWLPVGSWRGSLYSSGSQGEGSCLLQGWLSLKLKGKADKQSPLPSS